MGIMVQGRQWRGRGGGADFGRIEGAAGERRGAALLLANYLFQVAIDAPDKGWPRL